MEKWFKGICRKYLKTFARPNKYQMVGIAFFSFFLGTFQVVVLDYLQATLDWTIGLFAIIGVITAHVIVYKIQKEVLGMDEEKIW